MSRPPKYIIDIGDIYDDYKCIDIIQETTGQKDVDKPYTPENCCWICLDEQRGNLQKTNYFTVENIETGEIEYCKNALQYTYDHPEIPHKYIYDLLKYNRTYKGKKFTKITKQDFEEYKKSLIIEQNLKV